MNKPLKLADWARMFFDMNQVKSRILLGQKPMHWRQLSEDEKLIKCETLAKVIKVMAGEKPALECPYSSYNNDPHLKQNWHEITDLEAYGIVRPSKNE